MNITLKNKDLMKKKYVIFGATGSIGSSLANKLYEDKMDCHLIGRNEDELKELELSLNDSISSDIQLATEVSNYLVGSGGKRIRPFLIIELSKLLKIKKTYYMRLALAVEMVHAYSLIHDDLPGMDNDDLRRD